MSYQYHQLGSEEFIENVSTRNLKGNPLYIMLKNGDYVHWSDSGECLAGDLNFPVYRRVKTSWEAAEGEPEVERKAATPFQLPRWRIMQIATSETEWRSRRWCEDVEVDPEELITVEQ